MPWHALIFYDILIIRKSRTKSKTNVKGTVDMTKRKLLIIISAVIVVCLVAFSYFSNNYTETGLEKYNEKISQNSDYINFSLNELGSYDDVYFQSTKTGGFIFFSYGSMLIASYNDADFIEQSNNVALNYQSDVIFLMIQSMLFLKRNFILTIGILRCLKVNLQIFIFLKILI